MRWSLAISLVVHACILLAAVGLFQSPDEYEVEELKSVPVDLVSIEEFSKRMAVQKDTPKPEPEQKIAPKVKVVPEIKEIAPKPAEEIKQAAREPQPEPEPKPVKEPEPIAEPEPPKPEPEPLEELIKQTEEVEPEPEPVKKAAVPLPRAKPKKLDRKIAEKKKKKKKKPAFNTDDVAALLNKIDDAKAAPPVDGEPDTTPEQDELTSLIGNDDTISANELDWLRQRIGRCWNVPAGARDAQNLIVKIRMQMDPLGNVIGQPRIINSSTHPVFDAAARSALAAVIGCQPYDRLPAEKYNSWKDMIINFDPSLMLAIN